jgi:hypothetical protein
MICLEANNSYLALPQVYFPTTPPCNSSMLMLGSLTIKDIVSWKFPIILKKIYKKVYVNSAIINDLLLLWQFKAKLFMFLFFSLIPNLSTILESV